VESVINQCFEEGLLGEWRALRCAPAALSLSAAEVPSLCQLCCCAVVCQGDKRSG
jgi:hypothetical protein